MLCSYSENGDELHEFKDHLRGLIKRLAKLHLLSLHLGTTIDGDELRQDISTLRRILCEELAQSKDQVMQLWNGSITANERRKGTCERLTFVYISLVEYFIQEMQRHLRLVVELLEVSHPIVTFLPEGGSLDLIPNKKSTSDSGSIHIEVKTSDGDPFQKQIPLLVNSGVLEVTNINKSSVSFTLPRTFKNSRKNSVSSRTSLDADQDYSETPDLVQQISSMEHLLHDVDSCIHLTPWNMEGDNVLVEASRASLVSAEDDDVLLTGIDNHFKTTNATLNDEPWEVQAHNLVTTTHSNVTHPTTARNVSLSNMEKGEAFTKPQETEKPQVNLIPVDNGNLKINKTTDESGDQRRSLAANGSAETKAPFSATVSHNRRRKKCIILLVIFVLLAILAIILAVLLTTIKR